MIDKKYISNLIDKAFRNPVFTGRVSKIVETVGRRVAYEVMQPLAYYTQTTNATPVNIHVIEIADDEAGKIHVELLAVETDGTTAEAIEQIAQYKKTGGVLTVNGMWDIFDGDLAVALLIADDGNDNIKIEVTGIAATDIDWNCYITQRKIIATALP